MPSPALSLEDLLNDGELEAALEHVRAQLGKQRDPDSMLIAFGLEVRLEQFERAQATLQRLIELVPQAASGLAAYGRYARAEEARTKRLIDGSTASNRAAILAPPPHLLSYSSAAVQHAQGDHAGATAAIAEAERLRPRVSGTLTRHNGAVMRFIDLVDMDALTGAVLPCFGGDTLLDLPYSQLRSVKLLRPSISLDALWIPAELVLADGQIARVRVPALYTGSGVSPHAMARSGSSTLFLHETGYAIGVGQRDLEAHGEDGGRGLVGILSIAELQFDAPSARNN